MNGRSRPARSPRLRTGGDLLKYANRKMRQAGVSHGQGFLGPEEESLTLLGHALGLEWEALPACFRKAVAPAAASRFLELLRRRTEERVPTAYLVGEAWLGGLRFKVDERVIIPRSYFVELIPEVIPAWLPPAESIRRVADVCTGSGCLAVLLARRFPRADVDATDLSADALAVAAENVAAHGLKDRIRLHRTDVMRSLSGRRRYDLIISNPPYEPASVLRRLPAEFRKEPPGSLVSGKDGGPVAGRIAAVKTGGEDRSKRVLRAVAGQRFQVDGIGPDAARGVAEALDRGRKYSQQWKDYEKALADFKAGKAV